MTPLRALLLFLLLPAFAVGDEAKPNTLTRKEIEDGWILLFDGETTFGWKANGDKGKVEVKEGVLRLSGTGSGVECTSWFAQCELTFEYRTASAKRAAFDLEERNQDRVNKSPLWESPDNWARCRIRSTPKSLSHEIDTGVEKFGEGRPAPNPRGPSRLRVEVGKDGGEVLVRNVKLKPLDTKPLFNGKDLTGWKVFPGDKYKSVYSVTPEGWLNVKNGPGDLQTEGKYDDFVLQLECISNGKALNSGVFFRCIEGEYQNGYEMQIQNGFTDGDRTRPKDAGTGAIYRRINARKVVPNDHEWFGMTLLADGKHLSTWVDGIQVVDWVDERPEDNNPRKGSKTAKGHISLQGHDPTTDLSFRNIRIVEGK